VSASLWVWLLFTDTETYWKCGPGCLQWALEGMHALKTLPCALLGTWHGERISAASIQVCCPGIQCFWELAVSQALVADSVKLALDNDNSNALSCKGLSRDFGGCVGYSSCKQRFTHMKNTAVSWVPAAKRRAR